MKDWLDKESKLTLWGEKGSEGADVEWANLKNVKIKLGKIPGDIDCHYESDWSPWLYVCKVPTKTTMTTSDGKVWNVDSKYKWKFFFDDDTEMEFWIENPKALQQDDKEVELGMDDYENKELYSTLQQQICQTVFLTGITVK